MHSRIIHITLLAVAFILAFSVSPSTALDVPSQYEQDLLQLINEARENPLAVASSLGMDADQILQDFPDLKDILINGLPPLIFNENLCAAAGAHTQDMLENNYYSHISLDGRTAEDRIKEAGYNAVVFDEMLGLVAFQNFMPPEIAAQNLFEQLIKRDLLLLDSGKNNIFNPSMQDIGIGMMTGVVAVGNASYNAYMLTCDFGSLPVARFGYLEAEFLFLDLVNQARMAPLQTLENYGVDMTQLSSSCSALDEIIVHGLPPLVYRTSLREIALKRNEEIFKNEVLDDDHVSIVYWDNLSASECECPGFASESAIGSKAAENILPAEVVQSLFRELFIRELTAMDSSDLWILRPDVQEIGMILGCRVQASGIDEYQYVLSIAFGRDYLSKLEKQSLSLLNQARAKPAAAQGDTDSEARSPEWGLPMPPLIPSCHVFAAADAHARDMIQKRYYDTYSYDGTKDSSDRLAEKGYLVTESAETIGLIISDVPFDPAAAGTKMFEEMLASRMPSGYSVQDLFNPWMKTAGIRFLYTEPVEKDSLLTETNSCFQNDYTLLLVADQASPIKPCEANIVGLVFRDLNGDGYYNRGEEIESVPVVIRNGDSEYRFFSDSAGNFAVPLNPGNYEIEVVYGGDYLSRSVELDTTNIMLFFPF
jgi:uncharacterized protein YkwD